MSVKQISVFIENKHGKLAEVARFLADHNINLKALSIADTQDFGILRIICDDPDTAKAVLLEGGYLIKRNNVLAVALPDQPGALADILDILSEAGVGVEYTYAFLSQKPGAGAYMIFRVDDNMQAAAALAAHGIKTAEQSDLF